MNPTIIQEISLLREFLDQQNELGIVIGAHQNLDTVASALGLYLSLSQSGKKMQIISKKEPTVEVSNLVGIDRVKENFIGNTGKLIVSLPYIKGEVEKVLFTEAPNAINFHLTAAPDRSITPFDLSDIKLMWEGGAPLCVITIGVGSVDEINGIVDPNSTKIINIDNYQGNTHFGDVVLVDEGFSSLSEIIAKIIKDLQLPIDRDIAQNILDGVLFATRNFTKQNTSPLAFEAASSAMYQGAQRKAEEPRRSQNYPENRQNMAPRQDSRQSRDQRPQQNRQRVNDSDFPAMHMQQPRNTQVQSQNQGQGNDLRRTGNPSRDVSAQRPPQQFGQNRSQNDIRNKIIEESKRTQSPFPTQENIQDASVVEDTHVNNPPIEDNRMPEEQPYNPPGNEEIPDDWLMPKVFKSSKNNN